MLNQELSEVHQIMTKSIQEVLGHGEKLDSKRCSASTRMASQSSSAVNLAMTRMSTTLAMESKKYAGRAKDLHTQATPPPLSLDGNRQEWCFCPGTDSEIYADGSGHWHCAVGLILKVVVVMTRHEDHPLCSCCRSILCNSSSFSLFSFLMLPFPLRKE